MKIAILALFITFGLFAAEEDQDKARTTFSRGWIGAELFFSPIYGSVKMGGKDPLSAYLKDKKKNIESDFEWNVGYQVGLGVFLPILNWEILGHYRQFETKSAMRSLATLKPTTGGGMERDEGKFYEALHLESCSLELKRSSLLGGYFGIASILGLKQLFIQQERNLRIESLSLSQNLDYRGVGPILGADLTIPIIFGLNLVGNCKAALVLGKLESSSPEPIIREAESTRILTPNLCFQVGLRQNLSLEVLQLFFSLCYEADYYYRKSKLLSVPSLGRSQKKVNVEEDLVFYGIKARIGVDF